VASLKAILLMATHYRSVVCPSLYHLSHSCTMLKPEFVRRVVFNNFLHEIQLKFESSEDL